MFRLQLKMLRESKGISQSQLASDLGVSQGTVGNWESGIREPNFDTISKLANYFNVSVDYLLGRMEEPLFSSIPSVSTPHHCPTENTIHITRRTGAQSIYALSDENVELVEEVAKRLSTSSDNTSVHKNPLSYGAVAAEGGEYNRRPTTKPKTT